MHGFKELDCKVIFPNIDDDLKMAGSDADIPDSISVGE
jgi:hypothetical protein